MAIYAAVIIALNFITACAAVSAHGYWRLTALAIEIFVTLGVAIFIALATYIKTKQIFFPIIVFALANILTYLIALFVSVILLEDIDGLEGFGAGIVFMIYFAAICLALFVASVFIAKAVCNPKSS